MSTRLLVLMSSTIEAATAVALILVPELVAGVLFGTELSAAGIAVARVAGFGLLSLAIACWPRVDEVAAQSIRGLFVYNLLAGLYLGYLRVGGGFSGFLLLPACVLHLLLAILFARPAYKSMPAISSVDV